jgi:hypothetical protein
MNRLKMTWFQSGDELLCRRVDESEPQETMLMQQDADQSHGDSTVNAGTNEPNSVIGKAA